MLRLLGMAWSVWKVAAKRFGPAGGAVAAALAVTGFVVLKRMLSDRHPEAADAVEQHV